MAVNLFQTGVSALMAAQQQLATTGNNIANVNTEGYTRQRAEQNATLGHQYGNNYIGTGTYVQDITRIYDQFSYKEQLINKSNLGKADGLNSSLSQLNDIMNSSGQAVLNSMGQFYQAVNGIADNPSDAGLRSIALNQANVLASDFKSLSDTFDQLEKSVNGEISQIAGAISTISYEIAEINNQILQSQDVNTQGQPNELLDRRDQLITELGQYTRVSTVQDANGVMTVLIGSGSTLVAGITPLTVEVTAGDPDPLQTELKLAGKYNNVSLDTSEIGGSLGAAFEYRDEHLKELKSEINRLAMGISDTLNQSQADGLDLNGLQGANIFNDINTIALQESRVLPHSNNAGTLDARVNITDVSIVPTDEYQIKFDGTDYQMMNLSTLTTTNLGAPGTGPFDTGLGFEFVETSGAPITNDTFNIRPTENSAALLKVELQDGTGFAASGAVEISPSDNNVSAGQITIVDMYDPVNARAAMPMELNVLESPVGVFNYTFTDNTGAVSAPVAYVPPSQALDLPPLPATPLFRVEISGAPSGVAPNGPEKFIINDAFGTGNATNALSMALTQEKGILNGGKESFSQSLAISTADVGSKASSAALVADTAQSMYTQSYNRNQGISGVNLDEEAANMLKFQQAYQASSKIISVANTLFDTILSAVR